MNRRPLIALLREKREEILRIAAEHGAYNVRVFGSVARGEETEDSDIDFLIDVGEVHSSWFPAGLVIDLEELLSRKVDVVIARSVRARLKEQIMTEARAL